MRLKCLLTALVLVLVGICLPAQAAAVAISKADIRISASHKVVTLLHQALPFRWDLNFPGENGSATYTLMLPAYKIQGDMQPMGVLIPRVGNQAQIYLNRSLLNVAANLDDAKQDISKKPLLLTIPTALLSSESPNVLVIDTTVQALRWGGLSGVYYGTEAELRQRYAAVYGWRQSSYIVILVALVLMGLISLAIWLRQREELYGLFALSALWGGVNAFNQLTMHSWLPWPLEGIVVAVALAWHVVFMTRFTLGIVGRHGNWVRLTLLASTIAIGIAFVLAIPVYWTIAVSLLFFPIAAALIFTARAADKDQSKKARLLFLVSLVVALTALRDLFIVHIPESGIGESVYLPHALFLYVLMMGWILVERYTVQHEQYHNLSVTLDERVQEREGQLEKSFEQIQSQGEERAKLLERQRIMSDIHDGVGAQLVGLVNMIKRSQTTQSVNPQQLLEHAQMALDELRVAVDAMQPVDGDLATVLATLRYRLEPRLRASDIELVWRVEELPFLADLTPQKVLQIQRILLEAFTNIIKHAQSKTVSLVARHKPDVPSVEIALLDDGIGFDTDQQNGKGHGLGNMRFRANAIGARLHIESNAAQLAIVTGTTLTLEIPYQLPTMTDD